MFQPSSCHIVLFCQSVLFFCRWCFFNQTDDDDDVNDDDTDDDENRRAWGGVHVAAVILAT